MKDMELTFWGVVGSCPGANRDILEYGIATPCVEVRADDQLIILDCGTGIVPLGRKLASLPGPHNMHIFITHTHWDHIQGIPYFSQGYVPDNSMTFYGERRKDFALEDTLRGLMAPPYFPVSWDTMRAKTDFVEIDSGDVVNLTENCQVSSYSTNHPGGNLAYCIESFGKKLVYMTDLDHKNMELSTLIEFIKDADVLIYDANFTNEEYESDRYAGWGHSTWEFGLKLSKMADVKHLMIFHHAVHRKLADMHKIESGLFVEKMKVTMAREGMSIRL